MSRTYSMGIDCRFWGVKHAGLGRYTRELVLALIPLLETQAARSMQLTLFFQKYEWTADKKLLKNCKIIEVEIPHYSLKEQLLFGRIVDNQKLDLVHYPHFNIPILATTPFVVTIHDLIKHFFKGKPVTTRNILIYWLKYGAYRLAIRQAIQRAQQIIVPSYFVKDQIMSHYDGVDENKIHTIYEGVSFPYNTSAAFHQTTPKKNSLILKQYKLNRPYFIYTGSAYPSKDIPTLLKAFRQLNVSHPTTPYQLLIACARDHFWEKLQQMVHAANLEALVKLPGRVPDEDLMELYRRAIAFITPSLMEGFGLPGLEAMASGCLVIASETSSMPEIYGKAARYFQPGNAEDLVERMQEVLQMKSQERLEVIEEGKRRSEGFCWATAAKATLEVYQQVV